MSHAVFVRLDNRAVIRVAGPDRVTFLQGLVSNDMTSVAPERAVFAAFLTPQGKFLFDLIVCESGDGFLLDVEAARAADFVKRLSMYKLRAKVTIASAPDLAVFAVPGPDAAAALSLSGAAGAARPLPEAGGVACVDPRLAELGGRVIASTDAPLTAAGLTEAPFASWDEVRLSLGVPDGSRDLPVEKALLLENGFEELNGVDFNKGCYMGQELTARTKYRALVRKRLVPVAVAGDLPEPGTPVLMGESEVGEMRSGRGGLGLAMIRLDALRQPKAVYTCGGAALSPSRPDWQAWAEE